MSINETDNAIITAGEDQPSLATLVIVKRNVSRIQADRKAPSQSYEFRSLFSEITGSSSIITNATNIESNPNKATHRNIHLQPRKPTITPPTSGPRILPVPTVVIWNPRTLP